MSNTLDSIREHLINNMGVDPSIGDDDPLFSSKRLDSIDVLSLIAYLEHTFSIKYSPLEVSIETFDTVSRIADSVSCRQS